ncbi:MAG: hypothetical protein HY327_07995 [Chloroflexi bacterium]|nr:hypothetical protein [Chloroflexota bacterium]
MDSNAIQTQPQRLTFATPIWLTPTLFGAFAIANGILLDWLFATINAWIVLAATLAEIFAVFFLLRRRHWVEIERDDAELFGSLLIVIAVAAYLVYPSLPGLLPPARHFDAVNHTVLAQFISENNALPRNFTGGVPPYFMSGYPAGGALLGALVSKWLGTLPIQTIHPLISFILALAAGLVFLFTHHVLRNTPHTTRHKSQAVPIAFLSTFLLFTAWAYFPGSVNDRYFYAQNISQYFALAAFYFAYRYHKARGTLWLALMPIAISLVLVSHPTPIVAPMLAAFIAILAYPHTSMRNKLTHAVILALGLVPVAIIYVIPHFAQWVALTGYGEASPFDVESIGVLLPALALIGAAIVWRTRERGAFGFIVFLIACVMAQPFVLFLARFFLPAISPYYFEKSVYLLVYPLAILAALPIASITHHASRLTLHAFRFQLSASRFIWLFAFSFALLAFIFFPPRPFAPLTLNELKIAQWAKQNLAAQNIAVVSGIREDAYWVYWPLLGKSPSDPATAAAYHLGAMTYAEWRGNPGEPDYAIIRNLARQPNDSTVQVIQQIGESAILRKPRERAAETPLPEFKSDYQVGDMFKLIGYDASDGWTRGAAISLRLHFRTLQWPPTRTGMFVQILDSTGNVVTRGEREIFNAAYPTERYPLGATLIDEWKFDLPREALPGDYSIEIAFYSQLTGDRIEIVGAMRRDQIDLRGFRSDN